MTGIELQTLTLGECADLLSGGTPSKSNSAFWHGEIPWVSAKDMKSFFLHDSEDHITEEAAEYGTRRVPANSILVLFRGMTLHNDVPICLITKEMTFNQDVKALVPRKGVSPRWLAYWLLANKPLLMSLVDSASHGTGRIHTDVFKSLPVDVPSISVQDRIADVLGSLDDKIELNRQMNETLEAMARRLFKSWFVDFDPVHKKAAARREHPDWDNPSLSRHALPHMQPELAELFPDQFEESSLGMIPAGWRADSILEIANLVGGGTPSTSRLDYWDGDIKWASAKDVSQCGDTFLIETERRISSLGLEYSSTKIIDKYSTVIVARGATTGRLTMFGDNIAMNQTCYALKSKIGDVFFLYTLARFSINELVHTAHGSVFDTITTRTFETSNIIIPAPKVRKAFDKLIEPIFHSILSNLRESQTLTQTRDKLLPRLLSGELSVAAAEDKLQEVPT